MNIGAAVNFKKQVTSMNSKLEPEVWSHNTGQWICLLTVTWMSNIKDVRCKPNLYVLVNLSAEE